ncbi:MAG: hypothetical protein KGJ60_15800 [Verrucomicrobiota bacterium]|nr:hypothetical protein [Verrucomicrobiota bacterium]
MSGGRASVWTAVTLAPLCGGGKWNGGLIRDRLQLPPQPRDMRRHVKIFRREGRLIVAVLHVRDDFVDDADFFSECVRNVLILVSSEPRAFIIKLNILVTNGIWQMHNTFCGGIHPTFGICRWKMKYKRGAVHTNPANGKGRNIPTG